MKPGHRSLLAVALSFTLLPMGVAHAQWEDEEPAKKKAEEKKKEPPKKVEPAVEAPAKKAPPEAEEAPRPKKRPAPVEEEAPPSKKAESSGDDDAPPSRRKAESQREESRSREESPRVVEESDSPRRDRRLEREQGREPQADEGDPAVSERALSLSLGGLISGLGGLAFPRISLSGTADGGLYFPGQGGVLDLAYDFTAMELDWRLHAMGAYPVGLLAMGGTVGIRKLLGPWSNPVVVARGGAGLELYIAKQDQGLKIDPNAKPNADPVVSSAVMLAPVFLAVGETGIEYALNGKVSVGAFFLMALRYGVPIALGFDIGGVARLRFAF